MSPPGLKGEYRNVRHGAAAASLRGRPDGEFRSGRKKLPW